MSRATRSKRSPRASSAAARADDPAAAAAGPLLYFGWRTAGRLARRMSDERSYRIARRAMEAVYHCWPRGRRGALANARVLAAESDRESWRHDPSLLALEQFRRYGELLVDAANLPRRTPQQCYEAVAAPPGAWERLEAQRRSGPLILALMHFGAWDVLGGAWTHHRALHGGGGDELHVIADSLGHAGLDREMRRARGRLGVRTLLHRRGLRRAVEVLRAGGAVAVLIDRPIGPRERSVAGELFGREVAVSDVPGRLAVFTDAPVQPLAAVRTARGRGRFEGLMHASGPMRGDSVSELTQGMLDAFEPWLREHPEQWHHFRPVFGPPVARDVVSFP